MPTRDQRVQAAVLRPEAVGERLALGRVEPPEPLAGLVDYGWWVRWAVPEVHEQGVVPRPVVHLTVEEPVHGAGHRLVVTGVCRERFVRRLSGSGRVVAVAFRPGGFSPFLGDDVSVLLDRVVPAADLLDLTPGEERRVVSDAVSAPEGDAGCHVLLDWLASRPAASDPGDHAEVLEVARLVDLVETDTTITRVQQVAAVAGCTVRTLQRRFLRHVGVGPKWVVQRCRLLDVAAAAHADDRAGGVDWADLAARLGYADQSHLIRGFTALVGESPAAYVRRPRPPA